MTDNVTFDYRLPLTHVRVTGLRTETYDAASDQRSVECSATVTTEIRADLRTPYRVTMTAEELATQKSTWNLTPDGRLTGADVSTTAEPNALLDLAVKAGGTAAGLLGPSLVASGPGGWAALAGVAGATAIGSSLLATRGRGVLPLQPTDVEGDLVLQAWEPPPYPADADPAAWEVADAYTGTHPDDARALANLRCTLARASQRHAQALHAIATDASGSDTGHWERQAQDLQRVLAAASVGAARAESKYATWLAGQISTTTVLHDELVGIDELPTEEALLAWAENPQQSTPAWAILLERLQTAVSVDLEPTVASAAQENDEDERDRSRSVSVTYRPPRAAVVRIWKAERGADSCTLTPVDVRRIQVALPGTRRRSRSRAGTTPRRPSR